MDIVPLVWKGIVGGLLSVKQIAMIVIPMLVILQFARETQVLSKISGWFHPFARLFNISEKGTLPLLVGIAFGLVYGSGIIIDAGQSGDLEPHDMKVVGTFLSLCHAVLEDTMIFVAIGASGPIILGTRVALAVVITVVLGHFIVNQTLSGGREHDQNDHHLPFGNR